MRIVCPNCSAAYDVPPERMPPGRTVKCARCASSWTPVAEPAIAEPPPAPAMPTLPAPNVIERMGTAMPGPAIPDPAPPAVEPPFDSVPDPEPTAAAPPPAATPPNNRLLAAAWLGTVLILAGLAWFAISRRADIMRVWPPSERAYAAVGLANLSDRR